MRQIIDLIKMTGEETKKQNTESVKKPKPVQIDIAEQDEIDYVEKYEDTFPEVVINIGPSKAYCHELEMDYLANKTLSRGAVTTSISDIDYNEDPWERELRLERLRNNFLAR